MQANCGIAAIVSIICQKWCTIYQISAFTNITPKEMQTRNAHKNVHTHTYIITYRVHHVSAFLQIHALIATLQCYIYNCEIQFHNTYRL